jgi:hypothetical protein
MPFALFKGIVVINNAQLLAKVQILDGKWVDFYPF